MRLKQKLIKSLQMRKKLPNRPLTYDVQGCESVTREQEARGDPVGEVHLLLIDALHSSAHPIINQSIKSFTLIEGCLLL